MNLERKGDWIHTMAIFNITNDIDDIDYENLGIKPPEAEYATYDFVFNIKHLVAYNKSDEIGVTTIRLTDGKSYGAVVKFEDFDKFIQDKCKRKWYE